jgi:hypothetical protein
MSHENTIRNLRAILHNIEKNGLEAQLIKDGGFGDHRASRLELKRDGDGYRLGARQLTKEEAIERFLQHLVGRFAFVGQVVNAEGQDNRQISYRRVVLYKRLLKRLHSCVRDLSKNKSLGEGPKRCERAVRSLLSKYASFDQESEWYSRAQECRQSELKLWQEKEGEKILNDLARMTTPEEAYRFLAEQARKGDVRYWLEFSGNVEDLKSKVAEYARYPAANFSITRQVLRDFVESDRLGALTHAPLSSKPTTPARLLQILLERYEPHYYKLPKSLRDLIDPTSEALRNIVLQDGEGISLDLFKDPRTELIVKNLKRGTRLTERPGNDGTTVKDLLKLSHDEAIKRANQSPPKLDPWKARLHNPPAKTYTVIPALHDSLTDIFESMYRNSKSGQIEVDTSVTESGCFQIQIADVDSAG